MEGLFFQDYETIEDTIQNTLYFLALDISPIEIDKIIMNKLL